MTTTAPQACLADLAYHLPEPVLANEGLAVECPGWTAAAIEEKTGIRERRLAAPDQCASDLAVHAAEALFARGRVRREEVDYLLLCTQSPDYFLPTTACLLQDKLGLSRTVGALDFNLGCSGYVYGLGLAQGLIASDQCRTVLLLTADTYSRFLAPADRGTRALFGDGAAATVLTRAEPGTGDGDGGLPWLGPFVYGTDGRGGKHLIVEAGAARSDFSAGPDGEPPRLRMNGPEIFNFTLAAVPGCLERLYARTGLGPGDIDLFVFHQANAYLLQHLRRKLGIPPEKFFMHLRDCGNTVSSTLPIALREAADQGRLRPGARVALVGFGVGLSWAATLLRWRA